MKHFLTITVSALALTVASTMALADPSAPADPPKPKNICLNAGDVDHTSFPDDNTILFHMRGGKVRIWKNELKNKCQGLKFEGGIAYEIRGGSICGNMQVVYVINRWIPCMLGAFSPYTPPPKDAPKEAK